MKRRIVFAGLILGFSFCAEAQSDIKAMLKQIAKLEIYIVDLKKGYQIARDGLNVIDEIKNGEFGLHSLFFSSLKRVSPAVSKYSKITEILADQVSIMTSFKNLISRLRAEGRMSDREMAYVISVYENISGECVKCMNDLIQVTTDGSLEMTDNERIGRIDRLYADMKDKYAFTQVFVRSADWVSGSRTIEAGEIGILKSLE